MGRFQIRVLELSRWTSAIEELQKLGLDRRGADELAPKLVHRAIKARGISPSMAHALRQQMLALGGDVALPSGVTAGEIEESGVLILGSRSHIGHLVESLQTRTDDLRDFAIELKEVLGADDGRIRELDCRGTRLVMGSRPHVMGILNVTPDSFYDGGRYNDVEMAVNRARQMAEEGADFIDVGGESTRPGAEAISVEEEIRRVIPVVEQVAAELTVPISVDTYKAKVAEEALRAGAKMINDISGLRFDVRMPQVVAAYEAAVVIMHIKGTPRDMQSNPEYCDLISEIYEYLAESMQQAFKAHIPKERIIVDPGIGFGKTVRDNLVILKHLEEFRSLGRPVLVGPSRKSFIGRTLNVSPEERREGTAAAVALGVAHGADIVRVHDVKEMAQVANMAWAISRS